MTPLVVSSSKPTSSVQFSSPVQTYSTASNSSAIQYVGFLPRIVSFFIDYILITLTVTVIVASLRLFFLPVTRLSETQVFFLLTWITSVLIFYPYFLIGAVKFGGTIGKLMLGQMVVNSNGEKIDWRQGLLRYIVGYMVVFWTLGIGLLWLVFDSKKQGLHDKIANTYVIKRPEGKSKTAGIGCLITGITLFIVLVALTVIGNNLHF